MWGGLDLGKVRHGDQVQIHSGSPFQIGFQPFVLAIFNLGLAHEVGMQ